MFERWENFYILLGSASGGLIGLLFIVITLTAGMDRDRALQGASRYMTPTVVKFSAVLLTSAIASAPLDPELQRYGVLTLAVTLFIWALVNVWRMFFQPMNGPAAHWTDPWAYAAFPAMAYLALGVAAAARSAIGIGVVAVVILMLGVRNAWDLITWIAPGGVPRGAGDARSPTPPPE